ncbi:MAG: cation:proton antiporter [Halanaerobiales bacterium]|nr:cation:proton antiporter [Halanaerobiales bacterium]
MNFSLAVIIFLGILFSTVFKKIKLPGLLGMIIVGVLIGPYVFGIIDEKILLISGELRTLALIIILLRAGLGINKSALKKMGSTAVKMSFIPGLVEGFTILFASRYLLGISWAEAGMLGFIIAAVSPAVIVPSMIVLKEKGYGKNKEIPTMILASASVDDVIAITLFTIFLNIGIGKTTSIPLMIAGVPLRILAGLLLGGVVGYVYIKFIAGSKYRIRDTKKVLLLLGVAISINYMEEFLPIASLLGVMMTGFIILEENEEIASRLSSKLNKIWVFAEILLFVLIGSTVNIKVAFQAGKVGLLIIVIGLIARSLGVLISTCNSGLNIRERIFSVVAYIPKATVQAAIGAVPLTMGVENGEIILAIAVMSILFTAPLGAIGISFLAPRCLEKVEVEE